MVLPGLLLAVALAADAPAPPADPAPPVDTAAPAQPEKPRLFVVDLVPQGVTADEALALRDAVVAALNAQKLFDVVSSRDVQTLLGVERQRQLMGACADEAQCASEAGALLQARFVLSGQLSKVGDAVQLQLQGLDTEKSRPLGRSTRIARTLDGLRALVPWMAAEAVGAPLPPPPSKVPAVMLLAVGGATFVTGGILGLQALATQTAVNDQLCPGGAQPGMRCEGANLSPREVYVRQSADLQARQGVALGMLIGGAALTALGVVLFPSDVTATRFAARVVPTGTGVAVVGVLP